jgi:hypothetical protein
MNENYMRVYDAAKRLAAAEQAYVDSPEWLKEEAGRIAYEAQSNFNNAIMGIEIIAIAGHISKIQNIINT